MWGAVRGIFGTSSPVYGNGGGVNDLIPSAGLHDRLMEFISHRPTFRYKQWPSIQLPDWFAQPGITRHNKIIEKQYCPIAIAKSIMERNKSISRSVIAGDCSLCRRRPNWQVVCKIDRRERRRRGGDIEGLGPPTEASRSGSLPIHESL